LNIESDTIKNLLVGREEMSGRASIIVKHSAENDEEMLLEKEIDSLGIVKE